MKSHPFRRPQPLYSSVAALCIALSASLVAHRAHSANYNWDSNSATPGISDGGGTWNPTDSTWIEGGSNKPWLNGNTAVFGAGVDGTYPITVAFDPSTTGLIFNNSGYTLSSVDFQTITFASTPTTPSISVATGKTATISGNLTVTSGATASAITGGGTLVIENGGTVQNNGSTSSIVMRIAGTAGGGTGTTVDLKPFGTLSNNLNNTALFVSGALLVNGGTLNLSFTSTGGTLGLGQDAADSAGTITLNDGIINAPSTNGVRFGSNSTTATPGGTLNLNGGELTTRKLHKGTGPVATSVVNLNGGLLRSSANDATFMEGLSRVNVRNGGAVIDTVHNITIKQDLLHSNLPGDNAIDGGLTKQGSGTLILTGTNSYTGDTNLLGGTLSISDETKLGDAANKLNFNGGIIQVTGTAMTSLTRTFTWGEAGGGFDISSADNVFTLNQQLASGGGLVKRGAGTLILGGNNGYTGVTALGAGVLQLTNANSVGTSSITGFATASQLQLATGMTLSNPVRLAGAGVNNDGALKVLSGNSTFTDFGVNANSGTRLHIVDGASLTITNDLALSDGAAAQSLRIIGSGALELHGDSTAVLATSGFSLLIGDGVNAGPTIKAGNDLAFGLGTINFQPNSGSTLQSKDGTAHTFANPVAFNGTSAVLGATGTGDLTFTGDVTLGADLSVSINNSTTSFTSAIGDGGNGRGLTKTGPGTLILGGVSSYTGDTTVDAGSLLVNGSISGSSVVVNSGGTLGGSGTVGSVDLLGGTIAPGNGPGTLSTSAFSLDSTAAIKFELAQAGVTGGGINDLISVTGNLTLDGTLQVTPLSGFGGGTYPLFTYTGTLTDNGLALDSAFLAMYPGSAISTATPGVVGLVVVPEPTTGALLMISLGALAGFRRNRKHSRSTH